jgi:tRNA-dihydrouridine synthase
MARIITKTRERCPGVSLSAKIRTGFTRPEECLEILPQLRDVGCEWITVHHRTVKESYSKVDDRISRLTEARKAWGDLPFFASGDIFGVKDAIELNASGCCEGLVIARGLIRKPLLIGEVREALQHPEMSYEVDSNQRKQAFKFFESLLDLSRENTERYWSHSYCMELARNLFGVKDKVFRAMTSLSKQDGPGALKDVLLEQKKLELETS